MTGDGWFTYAVAAGLAGYLARGLLLLRLKAPPAALTKVNVRGRPVPAVIGGPMVLASLMVMALLTIAGAVGWDVARPSRVTTAVAVVIALMALAGSWDDRRGDERPRGFKGHLGAARKGALTGGVVKILAGASAGVAATLILIVGAGDGAPAAFERRVILVPLAHLVALVALSANFVNLTDRAPGRAAKVTLLMAVPLVVFGSTPWAIAAAPLLGGLIGCLGPDLRERAMLGDAGANPLGAVVGLGLALSLHLWWQWVAIAVLLTLNLASEKWSFSRAIERTPPLRWLDSLGRIGDDTVRERTAGE